MPEFVAVYMPSSPDIPHQGGFESEKDAWDWIAERQLCKGCYEQYKAGGRNVTYTDQDGVEITEWWECDHPGSTGCGAEWIVANAEELAQAETFEDVLKAGGYEEVYRREDDGTERETLQG